VDQLHTGEGCAQHRQKETNWCFHRFVAFIIFVGDLPFKTAEDFPVIGARIRGVFGGSAFQKRGGYHRDQTLVYRGGFLIFSTKFP
jgi:hypothetical protein